MSHEVKKIKAAKAALAYVVDADIVGIGTGSTVDLFIAELANSCHNISAVVASSERSKELLIAASFKVIDASCADNIDVYIDGADEIAANHCCIKGGGGALTGEKIIAAIADKFICIVDDTKVVTSLGGNFPLAIEVLPAARSHVGRQCVILGGSPVYREGFITDNGNIILDVYGLDFTNMNDIAMRINNIVGVVCHGLFIEQSPDIIIVGTDNGTRVLVR